MHHILLNISSKNRPAASLIHHSVKGFILYKHVTVMTPQSVWLRVQDLLEWEAVLLVIGFQHFKGVCQLHLQGYIMQQDFLYCWPKNKIQDSFILMWQLTGNIHCYWRHTGVPIHCLSNYTTDWVAYSVWKVVLGWAVWRSNPGGGNIFHIHPDQPWGPTSSYKMGTGSFPQVKHPRCGINDRPTSSNKVKERVELYLNSLSTSSW